MSNLNRNVGDDSPPDNPILNIYETYQRETPTITRTVMTTQVVAYVVNIFFDLSLGLGNIPVFTVYKFEIYRIFTSMFICTGFFSLFFAYFSFVPIGKRLERSTGSTEFGCLLLMIGAMTNALYIGFAYLLDSLIGVQYWTVIPSFGLWNILFGVISMESTKAPQGSVRRIFLFTVPTHYYPVGLWGFFSFLGGFSLSHLISLAVGYGFGYGYLESFRIKGSRFKIWEERHLQSFISADSGWIASNAALGSGAWSEDVVSHLTEDRNSANSLFSRWTPEARQQSSWTRAVAMGSEDISSSSATSGSSRPGRVIKPSPIASVSTSVLPTSGGQQLGGASRMQNIDPRQARLQALERRAKKAMTNANNA